MGRYGEDFYLNADLDTLYQYECMLNSNGLLFLTIRLSKIEESFIDYNTQRLYDLKNLNLIFKNWEIVEKSVYNLGSNAILVLRKNNK